MHCSNRPIKGRSLSHIACEGSLWDLILIFCHILCSLHHCVQNRADFSVFPMLSFYPQFWAKAFDFKGRIKRIDFWKIIIVNFVLAILLSKITPAYFYFIFVVASIFPGLSMNIRRIRDTGKQWQWIFIILIPIIGTLWMLWIQCQPSFSSEKATVWTFDCI